MQECARDYVTITPILGVYCLGLLLLALYLVVKMRHLQRQFSEYKSVQRVAVATILAPVLLVIIDGATGPEHGTLRRRMVVILSVFITGILFWIPVYQSVWAFIVKDEVCAIFRRALQIGMLCTWTTCQLNAGALQRLDNLLIQDVFFTVRIVATGAP